MLQDLGGRALLDDDAPLHHRDALGEAAHDVEIVRDEEQAHAALGAQPFEKLQDLKADSRVERRCRLVGDQQFRIARERHRDHGPLPLASGELVRIAARAALGLFDADAPHRFHGAAARAVGTEALVQLRAIRRSGRRPSSPD